nr:putative ribonuclease H-like domain-containing protein [Tanacetum cinerariifolium]
MRIKQYFLMTDYSLWEVILNGDSHVPTRIVEETLQPVTPTTAEQKLARKNELKARGLNWDSLSLWLSSIIPSGILGRPTLPSKMSLLMAVITLQFRHIKTHRCRFQPSGGYHVVPPPYKGTFMLPKPDLVFNTAPIETDHSAFTVQLSPTKPAQDLSHTNRPTAPIIEDWPVETSIPAATPKPASPKSNSSGKRRNRKACFVCKSVDHLIKDYDYHAKKMAQPTPRTYAHKVLTQSKPVSITAVRPVSVVVPKIKVTRPRLAHPIITKSKSPIRRHITSSPSPKTSNLPPRVTAVKAPVVSAAQVLWDEGNYKGIQCTKNPSAKWHCKEEKQDLIEAARTMLADSLLPIPFWAEAVNTACYVQNRIRTRIVQETLHANFLENKPNIVGSGPTLLFDIDSLTRTMNYQPVTAGNQTNPSAGFQDKFNAEKAREEVDQQYMLFPVWSSGSINPHNYNGDAAFDGKEHDFDAKKPKSEVILSPSSSAQSRKQDDKTKKEVKGNSLVESFTGYRDLSVEFEDCSDNSNNEVNAAELEDITYSDDENDVGAEADFNNLETSITVSPIPTTRIHKDHLVSQIIGDLSLTTQTRSMTRVVKDQGGLSQMFNGDFHTCMFACFHLQDKPNRVHQALKDPSWIEAKQEELLQFKMQKPLGFKDPDHPDKVYKVVKQVNDVTRLQALVDKKKVVITEAAIREVLRLDNAEGVDCLPNKEIFIELARIGYEKPSTKLTFYKAFFSSQWKFLIHTILQSMSSKRTSWNEFSSSMASAVICLSMMTLIEAARTMLADSLLPILFWAEAVNTTCYVQNRVLVTKTHNKTPYELLHGRTPSIGFMRPFGSPVTILNTLDSLGKFDGKVDEGFLVGYSTNPCAGFQDKFTAEKAREEIDQQYILFPVWSSGSTNPQNNDGDASFDGKEHDLDAKKPESEVSVSPSSSTQLRKQDDKTKKEAKGKSPVEYFTGYRDLSAEFEDCFDNNINEVNAAGIIVPTVGQNSPNNTNTFSATGPSNVDASPTYGKSLFINASQLFDDLDMPELEDITYSYDENDVGAEADFNNLETSITISHIPTTRVHKDHPVSQFIDDMSSTTQTKSMPRVVQDQGGLSQMFNDDFHTCMFACFLSQEEPKRVHQSLKDPSWIEAMQEELLQFKMQKVWVLVDLPHGKRAIGTK